MSTTIFVVGLNAPSLPLLPVLTCAKQSIGSNRKTNRQRKCLLTIQPGN